MKNLDKELVTELIDIVCMEAQVRPDLATSIMLYLLEKLEHPKLLASYEITGILERVIQGDSLNDDYRFSQREGAIMLQLPRVYEVYQDVEANKQQAIRFAGMQLRTMKQAKEAALAKIEAERAAPVPDDEIPL